MQEKSRGAIRQILIDEMVLNDIKKIYNTLGITWIDYKKAYYRVLNSWSRGKFEFVQNFDILNFISIITEEFEYRVNSRWENFGEA